MVAQMQRLDFGLQSIAFNFRCECKNFREVLYKNPQRFKPGALSFLLNLYTFASSQETSKCTVESLFQWSVITVPDYISFIRDVSVLLLLLLYGVTVFLC